MSDEKEDSRKRQGTIALEVATGKEWQILVDKIEMMLSKFTLAAEKCKRALIFDYFTLGKEGNDKGSKRGER